MERDVEQRDRRRGAPDGRPPAAAEANFQIQVLHSAFYRNKAAYIVGKAINGDYEYPFVVPVLHDSKGRLFLDAVLLDSAQIRTLFSLSRAYFMVDMEVPSAYVDFLSGLMPHKPAAEIYTMLGLAKQGKTMFYRDLMHHLRHSQDEFIVAPGIRGMVMAVFTLPSFPYVFKAIKDVFAPPKEVDRATVKAKYVLVKQHDRVGRMADTLEFSNVALPKARFSAELVDELRRECPSLLEEDGDEIVIKHVYIERRMKPLNLYLDSADEERREAAVLEYGNAIKELAYANIFPGDMLFKNFGVTRFGRVVFYDYDEIEYMTDCNFRRIPPAPNPEAEMSGEAWYSVGPRDVFPEEFGTFLLGNPDTRRVFMKHHADLLAAGVLAADQAEDPRWLRAGLLPLSGRDALLPHVRRRGGPSRRPAPRPRRREPGFTFQQALRRPQPVHARRRGIAASPTSFSARRLCRRPARRRQRRPAGAHRRRPPAERIADPQHKLPKTYWAQVEGSRPRRALRTVEAGRGPRRFRHAALRGKPHRRACRPVAARSADPQPQAHPHRLAGDRPARRQEPPGAAHDGQGRPSRRCAWCGPRSARIPWLACSRASGVRPSAI
jgi:hypothetical protein